MRADTWLADPAGRRSRVDSGVSTATPSNAASYQSIANRRRSMELPDTLIDHGYVRFPLSRQRNSKWARVTNKATPDSIVFLSTSGCTAGYSAALCQYDLRQPRIFRRPVSRSPLTGALLSTSRPSTGERKRSNYSSSAPRP